MPTAGKTQLETALVAAIRTRNSLEKAVSVTLFEATEETKDLIAEAQEAAATLAINLQKLVRIEQKATKAKGEEGVNA